MDREDIIRMAREAEFTEGDISLFPDTIAHFAALVVAAERDRMCQQFNIPKELAYEKATGNEAD